MISFFISLLKGERTIVLKDYLTFRGSSLKELNEAREKDPQGFRANLVNFFIKKEHSAFISLDLPFFCEDSCAKPSPLLMALFSSSNPIDRIYWVNTFELLSQKTYLVAYKLTPEQASAGFCNLKAKLIGVNNFFKPGCIDAMNNVLPSNSLPCLRADQVEFYKDLLDLPVDKHAEYISQFIQKLEALTGRKFSCIKVNTSTFDYDYALIEYIPFADVDIEFAIRLFLASTVPFDLAAEAVLATGSIEIRIALAQALADCTLDRFLEYSYLADSPTKLQVTERPQLVDRLIEIFSSCGDLELVEKLVAWKAKYNEHSDSSESPKGNVSDIVQKTILESYEETSLDTAKETPLADNKVKFDVFDKLQTPLETEENVGFKQIGWSE